MGRQQQGVKGKGDGSRTGDVSPGTPRGGVTAVEQGGTGRWGAEDRRSRPPSADGPLIGRADRPRTAAALAGLYCGSPGGSAPPRGLKAARHRLEWLGAAGGPPPRAATRRRAFGVIAKSLLSVCKRERAYPSSLLVFSPATGGARAKAEGGHALVIPSAPEPPMRAPAGTFSAGDQAGMGWLQHTL